MGDERSGKEWEGATCTWSRITRRRIRARMTKICSEKSDFYGRCTETHIGNLWFARTHKLRARKFFFLLLVPLLWCPQKGSKNPFAPKAFNHEAWNKSRSPGFALFTRIKFESIKPRVSGSLRKHKRRALASFHSSSAWWMQEMQKWVSYALWLTVNPPVPAEISRQSEKLKGTPKTARFLLMKNGFNNRA